MSMQLSDPRVEAMRSGADVREPVVLQAAEYGLQHRIDAVVRFTQALDRLAEKAADVHTQEMRAYNGLSNNADMRRFEYECMRRELITLYAHEHFLEVRF